MFAGWLVPILNLLGMGAGTPTSTAGGSVLASASGTSVTLASASGTSVTLASASGTSVTRATAGGV